MRPMEREGDYVHDLIVILLWPGFKLSEENMRILSSISFPFGSSTDKGTAPFNVCLITILEIKYSTILLPPFTTIRCFSFMKQMYLDIF
jgi:hypothetical protein